MKSALTLCVSIIAFVCFVFAVGFVVTHPMVAPHVCMWALAIGVVFVLWRFLLGKW